MEEVMTDRQERKHKTKKFIVELSDVMDKVYYEVTQDIIIH